MEKNQDETKEIEETEKNDPSRGLKVVIVDDAELSRTSISEILQSEGHEVILEAESAEAAMKGLQSTDIDLFIIDVVMPEVSGVELAKIVNEQFEKSTIIMMSSLNLEHIVIDAISNGAIDFLRKPFSKEDLLLSVNRVKKIKELRA